MDLVEHNPLLSLDLEHHEPNPGGHEGSFPTVLEVGAFFRAVYQVILSLQSSKSEQSLAGVSKWY